MPSTVSNGNCASTCAQFSTLMYEHYKVKIATFGGKPGEPMEYKGMAGNQVLEFADLKSEIKTARLNNSTLAPPDLLVNGNMRYVTSKPMFTMALMWLLVVSTGGPLGASSTSQFLLLTSPSGLTVSIINSLSLSLDLTEPPDRFPYTDKTYNNPEAVWTYA
jgi:hypothetical protein